VDVDEREEEAVRRSLVDRRFIGLFLVACAQLAIYPGLIAVAGGLRVAELFPEGASVLAVPVAATGIAALYILTQRVSQVAWTPFAGRLADRALTLTYAASTAAAAAAMAGLAATRDATAFVVLGAVAFFAGITSTVALELAIAHRTTAADRPRILGAYNTWSDAGAASGALAAGWLALAGAHVPFVIAAALAAGTLFVAPRLAVRGAVVGASAA
jgi:MFS family permease